MSNALKRARPVVEATVVSVALVIAALSVPAAIVLSRVYTQRQGIIMVDAANSVRRQYTE